MEKVKVGKNPVIKKEKQKNYTYESLPRHSFTPEKLLSYSSFLGNSSCIILRITEMLPKTLKSVDKSKKLHYS